MQEHHPTIRIKLWLQEGNDTLFGTGRVLLLNRIEKFGSLKLAADSLGMSYRAAWGKIKSTENALGVKLVEVKGSKRQGYQLTKEGRRLNHLFSQWFDQVEKDALENAKRIFPWPVHSYPEKRRADSFEGKKNPEI
jgi:molybdate transport system regulatory protein